MRVKLKFFALVRELAGRSELVVELEEGEATVARIVEEASKRLPGLSKAISLLERRGLSPVYMVNGVQVDPDHVVRDGDELAILPPASGGVEAGIVRGRISVDELVNRMAKETASKGGGAVVVFVGYVKGVVDGHRVNLLEYEAYEPYASRKLREIAEKYVGKPGVLDVAVYHRVGGIEPGDHTMYVAVAATDRRTAFQTAMEIVEEVKHGVPIFKLERRSDGDYWVLGDGVRVPRRLE